MGQTEEQVYELARKTGFQRRAPRKIDSVVFAQTLHEQSLEGTCSYNDLALRIDEQCGGGSQPTGRWQTDGRTVR